MTTRSTQLADFEEVESALLCELVDGLTATRSTEAVRTTIDTWKDRVQAAGVDPEEMLEVFKQGHSAVPPLRDAGQRWKDASKREFVLVCVAVYTRGCES